VPFQAPIVHPAGPALDNGHSLPSQLHYALVPVQAPIVPSAGPVPSNGHNAVFPPHNPPVPFQAPIVPSAGPVNPPYPSQVPIVSSAARARACGAQLAAYIRSGAFGDGQPLDPDLQTSPNAIRRRAYSMQTSTPNHRYLSGGGRVHNSFRSGVMGTHDSTPTRGAPTTGASTSRRFAKEQSTLPNWYRRRRKPSLQRAMLSMPFSDLFRDLRVQVRGVVKLANVHFLTLKDEILTILGKNAAVVRMPEGSPYFEVHIIVDRSNGQTHDVFVVVYSTQEAHRIVSEIKHSQRMGCGPQLGAREVQAEVATQEELMTALFPHATNVEWNGFTPRVLDVDPDCDPEAVGRTFTGFCGKEELAMAMKNVKEPTRVSH
jgi:hypothetical protein